MVVSTCTEPVSSYEAFPFTNRERGARNLCCVVNLKNTRGLLFENQKITDRSFRYEGGNDVKVSSTYLFAKTMWTFFQPLISGAHVS